MALRLGQRVRHVLVCRVDEIRDRAERDRHLRLRAARDEHAGSASLRSGNCLAPECGLPDPGLTTDEERARPGAELHDERLETRELLLASDERKARRRRHVTIVAHRTSKFQRAEFALPRSCRRPAQPTLHSISGPARPTPGTLGDMHETSETRTRGGCAPPNCGGFRDAAWAHAVDRELITKGGTEMAPKPKSVLAVAALATLVVVFAVGTVVSTARGAASATSPATLAHAASIRDEVNSRIRLLTGAGLSVTEATSTDMIDSFTLLSEDLFDARFVPARGGVWYTICPDRALCPYPASRLSRPASDRLARRLALELVLRTFLETDAPVVGVALPTPHFVAVVLEREELERKVDMPALAHALSQEPLLDHPRVALANALDGNQATDRPTALQRTVDELTRPRTYLFLDFEAGPYGPMSWAGMPCWPVVSW